MEARQNAHFEAKPADAEAADTVIRVVPRMADLDPAAWDALAGDSPFLRHAFLHALETTDCVGAHIGWEPVHLALFRNGQLDAAMPLYIKHHSWGEFVFDWAWADAYRRHGLNYYPKLVCCVPFSPVPGPRLLAKNDADRGTLIQAALKLTHDLGCSSFTSCFPPNPITPRCKHTPLLHRSGFQFHWHNAGYANFDDFLAAMTHDKRKKIRQERKKLAALGVTLPLGRRRGKHRRRLGSFSCAATPTPTPATAATRISIAHSSPPCAQTMPENLVLIIADRHGEPIACSFCIKDSQRLYGRHWGTLEYVPGLHFETCYQQGIEYAIAKGLQVFEGGAQGEHKLARGLVPTATHSWHWLENAEFRDAVDRFLERETRCHQPLHERAGRTISPRTGPCEVGTSD